MSVFPETSITLLHKLAADATGEREAAWVRFFDLYMPAVRRFAEWHAPGRDPDDVVQEVFLSLVKVLREGRYSSEKGRFRAFLSTLIRNQLISLYRRESARGLDRTTSIEDVELAVPAEQIALIDLKWRQARHAAAVEHILTKTALAEQSKRVYRFHVLEGQSAEETAATFGISRNLVGQIKFRVDRMIAIVEAEYND